MSGSNQTLISLIFPQKRMESGRLAVSKLSRPLAKRQRDDFIKHVQLLVEVNGFHSGFLFNRIDNYLDENGKFKTEPKITEADYNAYIKHYLQDPYQIGQPVAQIVANYLDVIFKPSYQISPGDRLIFEHRYNQILKDIQILEEHDPRFDVFWGDYCQRRLGFIIRSKDAIQMIELLRDAWQNNKYFTLNMLFFILQQENFTRDEFFDEEREPLISSLSIQNYPENITVEDLYPHMAIPDFNSNVRLVLGARRNQPEDIAVQPGDAKHFQFNEFGQAYLSQCLKFCMRATDYPTAQGLVTIPYDIDRAALIHRTEAENQEEYNVNLKLDVFFEQNRKIYSTFLYQKLIH